MLAAKRGVRKWGHRTEQMGLSGRRRRMFGEVALSFV